MSEDRKTILLRAALEFLRICGEGPFWSALTQHVFYDKADHDGARLANDIALELGEDEPY